MIKEKIHSFLFLITTVTSVSFANTNTSKDQLVAWANIEFSRVQGEEQISLASGNRNIAGV